MFATLVLALLPVLWLLPGACWYLPDPERIGAAQIHSLFVGTAVLWSSRFPVRAREGAWVFCLALPSLQAGAALEGRPESFLPRVMLLAVWCGFLFFSTRDPRPEARARSALYAATITGLPPLVGLFASASSNVSQWSPWTAAFAGSEEPWPLRAGLSCGLGALLLTLSSGRRRSVGLEA